MDILQGTKNISSLKKATKATFPKYVTASERIKLIGAINARFPDFGHHDEKEMGGLWLHPIKLLDGFWARWHEHTAENVNVWLIADEYEVSPWCSTFRYNTNLGHSQLEITQKQFCPEETTGIYISYTLKNRKNTPCCGTLEFLARTDLRPVWFAKVQKNGKDAAVGLLDKENITIKADCQEWYVKIGASEKPEKIAVGDHFGPEITHGDGLSVSFYHKITLQANEEYTLTFFVAGSAESLTDCEQQYSQLVSVTAMQNYKSAKIARYDRIFNTSHLSVGNADFENAYNWLKINNDWLIVDAGKFGRGLAAGIPEYIWWFGCDSCYAVQGLLAIGELALARDTLLLILAYSKQHNGNGAIVHEITTHGDCANHGNTQETAHFVVASWLYFEWTGDIDFIKQAFPYIAKSVDWLQQQDTGEEGFPSGYGIIEIDGLNSKLIDTAVYTAVAYENFTQMCQLLQQQTEKIPHFASLSDKLKSNINNILWHSEKGLFCDSLTKGKPCLDYNWVINTPMEMGISDEEKAHIALKNLNTPQFIGEWGMYLSGKPENAANPNKTKSPKHMMTINTAVMAAAQAKYGYCDVALDLIDKTFSTLDKISPGCIAEMSPDYGCFVQAWTVYIAMVITKYFWGINPNYTKNGLEITIDPQLPSAWKNGQKVQISNVPILDGTLTIAYNKGSYEITSTVSNPVKFKVDTGEYIAIPKGMPVNCQRQEN
ncbi:MAG: hypothetical protein FWG68_01140 [Defluviitaleaceae bacterium]|nr:hypothetical protein [Defluviitaleaceae bacterium]